MKSFIAGTDPERRSSLRKFFEKCGECDLAVSGSLEKLKSMEDFDIGSKSNPNDCCENTTKRSMRGKRPPSTVFNKTDQSGSGYFKTVAALPEYRLQVRMRTGTTIHFDFRTRLNTVRFGTLMDEELFQSVYTDGNHLIFSKTGKMTVRITAKEFMDLVLIDRTAIE